MSGLASFALRVVRRLKQELHRRFPALHDRILSLYHSSGRVQRRVERYRLGQLIDTLDELVEEGVRDRHLGSVATANLRRFVLDLRRETR